MSPPCPKGGGPVPSPGMEGACGSPTAIPGVPVLGRGETQNLSVLVQSIPSKDRGRIWASRELLALHGGLGAGEDGGGVVGTPCCLWGRALRPHLGSSHWGALSTGGLNSAPTASRAVPLAGLQAGFLRA